jgi:hypothetical protein
LLIPLFRQFLEGSFPETRLPAYNVLGNSEARKEPGYNSPGLCSL